LILTTTITNRKQNGFTVIELMISLTVLAVIISIAAPSFVIMLNNNRVTSATNDLIASMALARTEAVKRNGNVLMLATGGNWENGHQIGIDSDSSGTLTTAERLRDIEGPHSAVEMDAVRKGTTTAVTSLVFSADGELRTPSTAVTFTVDSTEDNICNRVVNLSVAGSTTLTTKTGLCDD
jgi:type IV fimbrial biogenesis protein FimT